MERFWRNASRRVIALIAKRRRRSYLHLREERLPPWYIGDFVYCKTPLGPEPSRVPIDIWECILDMLQDQLDVMAMCGRVCRAWRAISSRYTDRYCDGTLSSRIRILRFSQLRRAGLLGDVIEVTVTGGFREGDRVSGGLAHVASFAAMLAGDLPRRVRMLTLEHGEWTAGIPQSVFLHLATFTPITKLTLNDVAFPSVAVFGRLVCALSRLEQMFLFGVSFSDARAPAPLRKRWTTPPNLHQIWIDWSLSPSPSDMLRALAAAKTVARCHKFISYLGSEIPLDSILDMSLQQKPDWIGLMLKR
ncbi:hypothetical protein WOLCODRAFT_157252 [Wolfiporia cocos MD-104 SS10]|uniref:F-box domain-containing protein n=1 Tax=Wolfiporia cocos (strain MD-104) TaxID=742152 RepID=A0A2H3J301_WOLCO|nr:hypothetical protein WOLCODRAFT_157252 [Wolfiporia cocos MD-104 SS10]